MLHNKSNKTFVYTIGAFIVASSLAACGAGSDNSAVPVQSSKTLASISSSSTNASPAPAATTTTQPATRVRHQKTKPATTTPATPTTTEAAIMSASAVGTMPASVWMPTPGTSFQIQYAGTLDTSVNAKMYDVDAIDTPASTIATLKAKGVKVICYFSAGSYENYRSDKASFPASVLGKVMNGWPDERWLDIRQLSVLRTIMGKRMDAAASKGCDGVDPDNMDGYSNSTGFPLTAQDQLNYNKMIAQEAHNRNLSVGLKNDIDQVQALAPYFDWAMNEQCFQYKECGVYKAFTGLNKAVFGMEYSTNPATFCPSANSLNLDFLKKNLSLNAARISCREKY